MILPTHTPQATHPCYQWRPVSRGDLEAIVDALASNRQGNRRGAAETAARILDIGGEQLASNSLAAFTSSGVIAAIAFVLFLDVQEEHQAIILSLVHADHKGEGLARSNLEWLERRARVQFASMADDKPRLLRMSSDGDETAQNRLLEAQGFEAARLANQMRRDLAQSIPDIRLESGVRIDLWRDELNTRVMEAFNAAFKDHWGVSAMDETRWNQFFTGVPYFRGDLSLVAWAGDKIVGFCVNWVHEARNESMGVREGWVEAVGVDPGWRGKRIAQGLLARSMELFKREGMSRVALDVDTGNRTGALRLYEKLGFVVAKRTIHYTKRLDQSE